jgi:competence protein CoiA
MSTDSVDIKDDIITARCHGLVNQKAISLQTMDFVCASDVIKEDGPFMCPSCLSDAIVRKCTEKEDHFAHKARLSPIIQSQDRELHDVVQNELLEYLVNNYPKGNWAKERTISRNDEKGLLEIVPDISGRDNNRKPIAVEIQNSAYTLRKIHIKTVEYQKRNIAVLWLVPLKEELGEEVFRPRLFEKYLHSMYYGRVYYYIPNRNKKIVPVHFSPAKRWIEESTWYDVDMQEQRTEGGYFLTYRTIKSPNFGDELELSKDFKIEENMGFQHKNVKKEVPKCITLQDTLKPWWSNQEFKDLNKQKELVKGSKIFEDYDFIDEYDAEIYGE